MPATRPWLRRCVAGLPSGKCAHCFQAPAPSFLATPRFGASYLKRTVAATEAASVFRSVSLLQAATPATGVAVAIASDGCSAPSPDWSPSFATLGARSCV